MKELCKAAAIFAIVWAGISVMKSISQVIEEEELARHGAGESDYQRTHPLED